MSENPVFEATRTLLAVREYQDKPVPKATLRRIVESAWLTASASNRQPWHFCLVTDPGALKKLAELVKTGPYVAQAPAAVVVAYEKESGSWGLSDVSRAIQSMLLTAWEEGVGSNWAGGPGRLGEIREFLGFPAEYEVAAVVPFGYPKRKLGRGRKNRKPLDEVVSSERYGQPLKD
jgi:nitroreductase